MDLLSMLPVPDRIIETTTPAEKFLMVRSQTSRICSPLLTEDYVIQPVVDVSPPKWHLGHTTWFFENFILVPYFKHYKVFDDTFNFIFNSYYETVGKRVQRDKRGNLSRPSTSEVWKYRDYVDDQMLLFLGEGNASIPAEVYRILELGLNHEQQHQELLMTDLKYVLGNNPIMPAYNKELPEVKVNTGKSREAKYLQMDEGIYDIGYEGSGFCFDNEKGVHRVFLHAYSIMDRLVTNGEYIEFINDGGYSDFRHWLADGWDWVNSKIVEAPMYWFAKEGEWQHYTLRGARKLNPALPVTHISFYEADAFAKWKGRRLPTEFEWEAACRKYNRDDHKPNLLENGLLEPVQAATGSFQFIGDAWEWTNSAYLPYPWYEKADGALGEYNGKFMINQMVLRGGSCATPASHIRDSYRNFFPPDKQWQFSGIRLAEHSK